ncbi:MAG: S9 family peptidase [Saprospiraceae bacterium]|nr:S9 family peptidase [Saprospiraceae bacterium]
MSRLFLFVFTYIFLSPLYSQTIFTPADALKVVSIRNVRISPNGEYVAGITNKSTANRLDVDHFRFRDPNYVRPFTGQIVLYKTADGTKKQIGKPGHVSNPVWSPNSDQLAFFEWHDGKCAIYTYNLTNGNLNIVPIGNEVALVGTSELIWFPDGLSLIARIRTDDWLDKTTEMYKEATEGPITVYNAEEPFLKWDAISNQNNKAKVVRIQVDNGEITSLLPEGIYQNLTLDDEAEFLAYQVRNPQKTSYNRRTGNTYTWTVQSLTENKESRTLVDTMDQSRNLKWTKDRSWIAWSDSGHVFVQSVETEDPIKLTDGANELVENGDTTVVKFSVDRWNKDGTQLIARSSEGLWLIDRVTRTVERFITIPEENERSVNLQPVAWHPDGRFLYLSSSATKEWNRGLVQYDFELGEQKVLVLDGNLYRGWQLSEDGSQIVYSVSDGDHPDNLFTAKHDYSGVRQLSDLNPWITQKKMTRTELVTYLDSDGEELFGILYYPVDYNPNKKYPLVCEIYESFFNNGYRSSMNIIANAGYFGFRPSVRLETGRPGEAWIKGVTAGINKLIERGLIDPKKIGVHGVSYGGYATSLLIAQTNRFAAAINISGKTNVISFLGDSPRIGTRNYAAAEVGQDRLGETLWEAPMTYIDHSAVFFADKMNTPHLLLTGAGDWNVPAANTRELYYALRRLGKKVVWVDYQRAGHGGGWAGTHEDFHDQWNRVLSWYEEHFKEDKMKE